MSERYPDFCPSNNICAVTLPQGAAPECGSAPEHLSPLIKAEELCLRAFWNGADSEQAQTKEGVAIEQMAVRKLLDKSGHFIDQAMSPYLPSSRAQASFAEARTTLDEVLDTRDTVLAMHVRAALLRLYLPLFERRRERLPIGQDGIIMAVRGLAAINQTIDDAEIHTIFSHPMHLKLPDHQPCLSGEQQYQQQKLIIGAAVLALQQGILPYPSTPRESLSQDIKNNHLWYALDAEGNKVPFTLGEPWERARKKPETRQTIARLAFGSLVNKGFENRKLSSRYFEMLADNAFALCYGESLHEVDQRVMDGVSGDMLQLLRGQQARNYPSRQPQDLPSLASFDPADIFPVVRPKTADNPDLKDLGNIDITETGWTILPQDHLEDWPPELAHLELDKPGSDRNVEKERLIKLLQLAKSWGNDAYLAVSNLDAAGKYDYIVAVLPQQTGSALIEHAIAENPQKGNALYAYRGDLAGTGATWRDVFSATKSAARTQGARRLKHTETLDERLLDYLTQPADTQQAE